MSTCNDCRWFLQLSEESDAGECFGVPPTVVMASGGKWTVWPTVKPHTDRCGTAFEPKAAQPDAHGWLPVATLPPHDRGDWGHSATHLCWVIDNQSGPEGETVRATYDFSALVWLDIECLEPLHGATHWKPEIGPEGT